MDSSRDLAKLNEEPGSSLIPLNTLAPHYLHSIKGVTVLWPQEFPSSGCTRGIAHSQVLLLSLRGPERHSVGDSRKFWGKESGWSPKILGTPGATVGSPGASWLSPGT